MAIVAAIQMCSSDRVAANLQVAATLIQTAAQHGAELIVLPENFALMGQHETDKVKVKEEFGHGEIQDFLANAAIQHKVWIVAGTIPIACSDKHKVRAASLVFNAHGECVARYDKMHLFDVAISANEAYKESATIEAGDAITVVDTPIGKLGLAVCYDVRFPELFRRMFQQGAEILILPAAFTVTTGVAHWEILTRSRAIENFCYLIGAAQGGTHANGRKTYGHSLIVEPWGTLAALQSGTESGVIYAEIDLAKLHAIRKSIPVDQHHRLL